MFSDPETVSQLALLPSLFSTDRLSPMSTNPLLFSALSWTQLATANPKPIVVWNISNYIDLIRRYVSEVEIPHLVRPNLPRNTNRRSSLRRDAWYSTTTALLTATKILHALPPRYPRAAYFWDVKQQAKIDILLPASRLSLVQKAWGIPREFVEEQEWLVNYYKNISVTKHKRVKRVYVRR